jgi:hypothetical protein
LIPSSLAATLESPRYIADRDGLYTKLRASKVVAVRKITSLLEMTQNRQSYSSNETDGTFHMSDTDEGLKFYVPRNRKKQDTCFTTSFPQGLLEWLMQDPNTLEHLGASHEAEATLSFILSCSRSALDEVLDRRGIIHIDVENQDPEGDAEDSEENDDASVSDVASESRSASELWLTPASTIADNPLTVAESISRQTNHASSRSPESPLREVDGQYVNLLDRVIRFGRNSGFPSQGAFDMSAMQEALSNVAPADAYDNYDGQDITFRFRSANQLDRDKKVGAAGELYVSASTPGVMRAMSR